MTSMLSSLGRAAGRLVGAAATPLVPSDYVELVSPLRGPGLRARVVAVQPEPGRAVTVHLKPGDGWAGHRPGQYLRLGVDVDGVRLWRSYSITSTPGQRNVTITVRRQGQVSDFLATRLAIGTVVHLDQAAGEFGYSSRASAHGDLPAKALFVTAGSGITPIMGMLRSAVPTDVVVVHSARTPKDVIFGEELRGLARTGQIRLVEWHTALNGRLPVDQLETLVPDIAERATWVCGPGGLIDDVVEFYAHREWEPPVFERFQVVRAVTGEGGTVRFTRSGPEVAADAGTPLLEAGESAGVLLPFGCRMGVCYGCVTPLLEGAVRDLRDGAITQADADNPILIQTCINAAAGPCALDA